MAADALGDPADGVAEHELDCVDIMLLVAVNVAVMLLDGEEADGDAETLGVAVALTPGSAQHSARVAHAARGSHRLRAIMWRRWVAASVSVTRDWRARSRRVLRATARELLL